MGHRITGMQTKTNLVPHEHFKEAVHLLIAQLISATHMDVKVFGGSEHRTCIVGAGNFFFLFLYH